MGQEVAKKARIIEGIEVFGGVDIKDMGDNFFPVYTDLNDITSKPDVIIDFSIPEASFKILEYAKKNKIPTVIATTGFSEKDLEKVREYGNYIPVFQSYNMSYTVSVMSKIVSELAQKLENADIEIVETHHRRKIDSPSGTAILLANSINEALDGKMDYEYNRHSKRESRKNNEIGIHSIRGGTESGKHSVIFFGEDESLEITHNVTSRAVFAEGAIKAAKFLVHKDKGLYTMKDLS